MQRLKYIFLILSSIACSSAIAQSKIYISGGIGDVTVYGNLSTLVDKKLFEFKYKSAHFEYERRVIGAFNVLTGLSVFQAGYETESFFFGARSTFRGTFTSIPLMVRWNAMNKNAFFVDFGVLPTYMVHAYLKESVYEFGQLRTVKGNITRYCDRLSFATKFQMIIPFNRFHVGFYFQVPLAAQSGIKGLEKHWGINSQQSTYLLANGFSKYSMVGFNVGVRLR